MGNYSNSDFIERMEQHKRTSNLTYAQKIFNRLESLKNKSYMFASKLKQKQLRSSMKSHMLDRWL